MDNEAVDCPGEQLIYDEYRHPLKILHTKLIHAVVDYSRNKNLAFDIDVPHLKKSFARFASRGARVPHKIATRVESGENNYQFIGSVTSL